MKLSLAERCHERRLEVYQEVRKSAPVELWHPEQLLIESDFRRVMTTAPLLAASSWHLSSPLWIKG